MKEALVILTVLGCDHSEKECAYIDTAAARYETVEACYAQSQSVFSANAKADYPVVIAKCEPAKPNPVAAPKAIVDRAIDLSVETSAAVTLYKKEDGWFYLKPIARAKELADPVIASAKDAGAQAASGIWAMANGVRARFWPEN